MDAELKRLSVAARRAMSDGDWGRVGSIAVELRRQAPREPEGAFLMGMAQKAARRPEAAADYFEQALALDATRYDAAIELASLRLGMNRHAESRALLDAYTPQLGNSPLYLEMAGAAYLAMSLHEDAWQALSLANARQPGVPRIQARLATAAVYVGKLDEAKSLYRGLMQRFPKEQRYHYEFAQLQTARDDIHLRTMRKLLRDGDPAPAKNIYLYYAIGKELEDLERWDEAFNYYEKAGNAVKSVADYRVEDDVAVIDRIIATCSSDWLADEPSTVATGKTPIFVVGLPRTGTTLTDRILSSHSSIQSGGETQYLQMVLRDGHRAGNVIGITPAMIELAARRDPASIAMAYIDAISFRLGDEPYFVEKLPENMLYLGFVAKAWPDARIVHLCRHPMDACFAMFKQSYFRFAYSLEDLAKYYLAYTRLADHWRETLGERMIELEYERLVSDFEPEVRRLLKRIGLPFEDACLAFDRNVTPVATASSAQVRERVHLRSVGKWRHFEARLAPLTQALRDGGVEI